MSEYSAGGLGEPRVVTYAEASLQSRAVAGVIRCSAKPVIALWARFPRLPWPFRLLDIVAAVLPPVAGVVRVFERLPNSRAEVMCPKSAGLTPEKGAILYLHGGAFLVGGLRSHRRLVSRLVAQTGVMSLAVDYRKLPRHSVADALNDCVDGFRRLLQMGVPADRIAIVGDSAGGYFSLLVALIAQEQGLGRASGVACMSPLVDLDPSEKLARVDKPSDALFTRRALETMDREISRADGGLGIPTLLERLDSGGRALTGMPPLLVQVGAGEILRPDAELIVRRLGAAGVPCRLETWAGQVHVFQAAADIVPEARRAIDHLADFVRYTLANAADTGGAVA